ncbi:MAG: membrane dipeptidase [Myxococcota bacterium]|nr:membrane dipeptidase [Myxococcota bacterium]
MSLPEVSSEAHEILKEVDLIDLHLDGMIPHRLVGYDLNRRHGAGLLGGNFFGHLDFPRAADNGLAAGMWSVTTNPLRTAGGRWKALLKNLESLKGQVDDSQGAVALARTASEYRDARGRGAHVVLPAIQGGNALVGAPEGIGSVPDDLLTRVTLVHLTNSEYGVTSSPLAMGRRAEGLTGLGRELVRDLNSQRVFVDLAHINPQGFWDAIEVHDPSQPILATHTGVDGVLPHWRNLDDDQLRAVAETGGVIGIIFHVGFLARSGGPTDGQMVLEHMEHVIEVVGEDHVAIGSDYDGAIRPPHGLRKEPCYPRLVQWMLDRGWSGTRVEKALGGNFLRCLEQLRP